MCFASMKKDSVLCTVPYLSLATNVCRYYFDEQWAGESGDPVTW